MNQFKNIGIVLALLVVVILLAAFKPSEKEILRIKITNVKVNSGDVIVEIYDNKSNWLKTPFRKLSIPSTQNVQTASFEVLYGNYAVTVYQDKNKNGEISTSGCPLRFTRQSQKQAGRNLSTWTRHRDFRISCLDRL